MNPAENYTHKKNEPPATELRNTLRRCIPAERRYPIRCSKIKNKNSHVKKKQKYFLLKNIGFMGRMIVTGERGFYLT